MGGPVCPSGNRARGVLYIPLARSFGQPTWIQLFDNLRAIQTAQTPPPCSSCSFRPPCLKQQSAYPPQACRRLPQMCFSTYTFFLWKSHSSNPSRFSFSLSRKKRGRASAPQPPPYLFNPIQSHVHPRNSKLAFQDPQLGRLSSPRLILGFLPSAFTLDISSPSCMHACMKKNKKGKKKIDAKRVEFCFFFDFVLFFFSSVREENIDQETRFEKIRGSRTISTPTFPLPTFQSPSPMTSPSFPNSDSHH